jgi:hypothetical protein
MLEELLCARFWRTLRPLLECVVAASMALGRAAPRPQMEDGNADD